ncbi:hypothetical protein TNIN_152041 [Trichonephila inaurata madagascariensis]|uniref:Uncharacterized protein n=1 Tax=Trichonephila inaurata madagascariensis TaxID=2747483 RepID=A0A8X6YF70_9ARAC|nr:hypothetical protein TNIN_152041 [Trichonephila inaurata madagascariensis]
MQYKRGLSKIPLATFLGTKEIKKTFHKTLKCSADDSLMPNSLPRPPFKGTSLWPTLLEVDHPRSCFSDIWWNILRNRVKKNGKRLTVDENLLRL